jgi:hypothetical protein
MKKLLTMLLVALAPLVAPARGQAGFLLSVSSSADVNHLTVGQSVTFNVDLSGVTPGDPTSYLSYLAATVKYDTSLLSPSPAITVGAIVPDATNFFPTSFTDKADGFYDSVFGIEPSDPISTNDTFFSFTVTTRAAGDGTISFEADAATFADDPTQTNQFNPDTRSLSFHIGGATAAVPEPGSLALLLTGVLAVGGALARRRRARGTPTH